MIEYIKRKRIMDLARLPGERTVMPTIYMRMLLFFSSYFPLFLILGILFASKNWILTVAIICLGSLTLFELWRYLHDRRRRMQHSFSKILDYSRRDSEAMSYIASYVVPFATFSLDVISQALALAVFVIVLMVLYVNSNMIYINPMLNLVGYHLYEIEIEHSSHSHYYLARKRLARGEIIHYVRISDEVLLEQ
jgi:hypothetical protein